MFEFTNDSKPSHHIRSDQITSDQITSHHTLQNLSARFSTLVKTDFDECDLLIVMGTSLNVQPFASLVNFVADHVPRLLINRWVMSCGCTFT